MCDQKLTVSQFRLPHVATEIKLSSKYELRVREGNRWMGELNDGKDFWKR